jgi:uncharacterized protein (DUF1786 family)
MPAMRLETGVGMGRGPLAGAVLLYVGAGNALVFSPADAVSLASDLAWVAELVRSGVSLPVPPKEESPWHGKPETPDPRPRRGPDPGRRKS